MFRTKYIIMGFVLLLVAFASTFIGFYVMKPSEDDYKSRPNEMITNKIYPIVTNAENNEDGQTHYARITPNTTIQYNYKNNGIITKTLTQKASSPIINLTEVELRNTLNDVEVAQFNEDLVILEKEDTDKSYSYIVGSNNGFISVFYKDVNDTVSLYNQTSIPIDNLPIEDRKLLEEGINAKDDAELNKIIEDYSS